MRCAPYRNRSPRSRDPAGAVAREFGLALDRHLRDDAHPLSQAPDADEIGSTPAASTYCAGSSSPPVQSLDSTAGLYGSAPRTVFAALDLSSYHAVHAGAARDAVTVDDATVLPSTDHGEANTIPASVSGRPWRHITMPRSKALRSGRSSDGVASDVGAQWGDERVGTTLVADMGTLPATCSIA